mmetsp:Transcript_21615/g.66633  ORF Transcript_21615/g.66633 Transcript_21615/m.66633 type:complete len:81 (+) Transcript_21615:2034-2276(+)
MAYSSLLFTGGSRRRAVLLPVASHRETGPFFALARLALDLRRRAGGDDPRHTPWRPNQHPHVMISQYLVKMWRSIVCPGL